MKEDFNKALNGHWLYRPKSTDIGHLQYQPIGKMITFGLKVEVVSRGLTREQENHAREIVEAQKRTTYLVSGMLFKLLDDLEDAGFLFESLPTDDLSLVRILITSKIEEKE